MMRTIERENEERLEKHRWIFYCGELALSGSERGDVFCARLRYYYLLTRPTRRHAYREVDCWEALDQRNNTIPKPNVPTDVAEEALRRFREAVVMEE